MEHLILVTLEMVRLMEKEDLVMQMVIPMRVHLLMIRLTVLVSTYIMSKCKNIAVNGKTICSMAMVEKNYVIIPFMKETSCKEKNMDRVNIFGPIRQYMKVNGKITR